MTVLYPNLFMKRVIKALHYTHLKLLSLIADTFGHVITGILP